MGCAEIVNRELGIGPSVCRPEGDEQVSRRKMWEKHRFLIGEGPGVSQEQKGGGQGESDRR